MFSKNVLKRFVKDYSLPIQIIQEPYFNYYINLYNPLLDTKYKLKLLDEAMKNFNSEEDFLKEYFNIRDKIIDSLKNNEAYNEYNTMDMKIFNVLNKGYSSNDIFKTTNIGKMFMSIDLKKANFQALKYINKELVSSKDTYEDFLGLFTNLEYMKQSKYLRQVIFGNINPKRQVKVERYIIEKILETLLSDGIITEGDIKSVRSDEIVVEISKYSESFNEIAKFVKDKLGFNVDVEVYKLNNIGNCNFFVKEFLNKQGYELCCVPLVYYAQAYKKYNELQIIDKDLSFYYEHQICKFIEPMNFESEGDKYEHNADERETE